MELGSLKETCDEPKIGDQITVSNQVATMVTKTTSLCHSASAVRYSLKRNALWKSPGAYLAVGLRYETIQFISTQSFPGLVI